MFRIHSYVYLYTYIGVRGGKSCNCGVKVQFQRQLDKFITHNHVQESMPSILACKGMYRCSYHTCFDIKLYRDSVTEAKLYWTSQQRHMVWSKCAHPVHFIIYILRTVLYVYLKPKHSQNLWSGWGRRRAYVVRNMRKIRYVIRLMKKRTPP